MAQHCLTSGCSLQEKKQTLPPSIANLSLEESQKLNLDTLKKLKARDKKIVELTAANEKLTAVQQTEGGSGSTHDLQAALEVQLTHAKIPRVFCKQDLHVQYHRSRSQETYTDFARQASNAELGKFKEEAGLRLQETKAQCATLESQLRDVQDERSVLSEQVCTLLFLAQYYHTKQ